MITEHKRMELYRNADHIYYFDAHPEMVNLSAFQQHERVFDAAFQLGWDAACASHDDARSQGATK